MRILARILGALAALAALVLVLVVAVYVISGVQMRRTYALDTAPPAIPTDSATVARGQHLGRAIGKCVECHGGDLGGKDFIDGGPLGHVWAPNLTRGRGGAAATRTDAQLVNAVRRGLRPDGRSLLIMPSEEFQYFSDEDLGAVLAWVKSVPPVDRELPPSYLGPLGRALLVAGQLKVLVAANVDHANRPPARRAPAPTAEYGRYLAVVGGCTGCHGPGLSGGKIPGTPPDFKPPANITPTGIGSWSEADFTRALREGRRPTGAAIDTSMPWRLTREMTDDEIHALYSYLRTVPPKAYGGR